jgi:hypothetical protein
VAYLANSLLRLVYPAAFGLFLNAQKYYLIQIYFSGFSFLAYSVLIYALLWWNDTRARSPYERTNPKPKSTRSFSSDDKKGGKGEEWEAM